MSSAEILKQLQEKMNISMYGLGKRLKLKSSAHAWLLIKGGKLPNLDTCHKIIHLGKEYGMKITLDMLRGSE